LSFDLSNIQAVLKASVERAFYACIFLGVSAQLVTGVSLL